MTKEDTKMGIINYCLCDTEKNENDNCHKDEQKSLRNSYWTQLISGASIYFLCINHGVNAAWTSPALPYLTNGTADSKISEEQGAWIASITAIGTIFSTLMCPFLLDRIGRKNTTLVSAIPALVSWLIIIFTKNYIALYTARFINGIASGITYSAATLYFAEIAAENIRGIMITTLNVCSNLGTLFVVSIGAFFTYEIMNIVMMILPILALMTLPLMLETPYFLLMTEQEKKALTTLMRLRGTENVEDVNVELERMKLSVDESQNQKKSSLSSFRELFDRGNRRGLLIMIFATAAMYLSGVAAIEAYTEEIFSYSNFSLNSKYSTMILGLVRIVAGLSSTLFIDRERKLMLLISGTLSSFSLVSVGFFYFIDSKTDFDASSISWIPLIGLVLYLIFCNLGLVSIPAIFMGELFTINAKGKAAAIGIIFAAFFTFVTKFWFQELRNDFGMHMPFWIFAVCCLVCTFVVFWISPETSGKNLEEVQRILRQRRRQKNVITENWELARTSTR